jgi:hypothetical protein
MTTEPQGNQELDGCGKPCGSWATDAAKRP